jgi:hypothetical protein
MNLLSIILYSRSGARRAVDFRPGELNVVTGWSATGKSALLDIVEFCLGRGTVTMPVGPITNTVAWYAVLVQLPSTRAFVARPAPKPGRASTQQAMLEFGANLQPLAFDDLGVNADSATVREQLGRLLGIGENLHEPEPGSLRSPLEANLAHALLLCLQGQGEIGNRDLLFHRQGETGIGPAIRDTLPYFLGAVPGDQALKRQELRTARRNLRRLEAELAAAERLNDHVEVELRALLIEAHTKGLIPTADIDDRDAIVAALTDALNVPPPEITADDDTGSERRRNLEQRRDQLRRELRDLAEQRALLDQEADGEQHYEAAVRIGASRLESLNLVRPDHVAPAGSCPICGSGLAEADPTIEQLRQALDGLRGQLRAVETSRPRRAATRDQLDARTDRIRQDLRATETALAGLHAADAVIGATRQRSEDQAFTKGRIDLYLAKLRHTGNDGALAHCP